MPKKAFKSKAYSSKLGWAQLLTLKKTTQGSQFLYFLSTPYVHM